MKRRTFIAGLGSAAAWPVVARAQQAAPVIGFLSAQSTDDDYKNVTVPFLQGLKEAGYVEGQNVPIDFIFRPAVFDRHTAALDKAYLAQAPVEGGHQGRISSG